MFQIRLAAIVFLSGASVMILELCGSRLLAPIIGNSFYVWTSLIGSVLAALSIGYWKGGELADRNPSMESLSLILFVAAGAIGIVALLQAPFLIAILSLGLDQRLAALIACTILFGPPCVALGMVQPFAMRLTFRSLESSGRSVGLLTAWSTLGSIAGTFLLGFFLFIYVGTVRTLFGVAFLLALASLLVAPRFRLAAKLGLLFGLYIAAYMCLSFTKAMAEKGAVDMDTAYQRVMVFDTPDKASGRNTRILVTTAEGSQSMMDRDHPDELITEYLKVFKWAMSLSPSPKTLVLVGGGGYSLPKELQKIAEARLDVVEVDPGMTDIAKNYFSFSKRENVRIFHEDARVFFRRIATEHPRPEYDIAFLDAFSPAGDTPFHLATREFFSQVSRSVTNDGLVVMNIIAALEGPRSCMFRHLFYGIKEFFPDTAAFQVFSARNAEEIQNLVIIGRRGASMNFTPPLPDGDFDTIMKLVWKKEPLPPPHKLTDDYAPVEYLTKFGC